MSQFVSPHSLKAAHVLDCTRRLLRKLLWNPNMATYTNTRFTDTMVYGSVTPEIVALMSELGFKVPLLNPLK